MKILSLFDGMSCAMLALLDQGIKVDKYVAYEIDKYAIKTATHNFPEIEQRGDVFTADFTEFRNFDYLMGGSPCTYWSIAQKNNRETEASGLGWELFSQYERALREAQPRYFIYENNKSMSNAIRESITDTFGFEPICINSALLSAQNRQRLYWVGKRNDDGTYSKVEIEQPEDAGILLKDILENGTAWRDKSYLIDANYFKGGNLTSPKKQSGLRMMAAEPVVLNTTDYGDKSRTLMAGYYKYGTATLITNKGFKDGTTCVAEPVATRIPEYGNPDKSRALGASYAYKGSGEGSLKSEAFPDNPNKQVRDYVAEPVNMTADGKAQCLRATCYKDGIRNMVGNDVDKRTCVAETVRVGSLPRPNGELSQSQAFRVYDIEGKSVNLTSGGGGAGGKTGLYAVPLKVGEVNGGGQGNRIYSVEGKAVSQTATSGGIGSNTGLYAIPVETEIDIVPFVENKLDKAVEKFGYIPEMWNPYNNAEITDKAPTQTAQCASQTKSSTVLITAPVYFAEPCEWDEDGKPIKAISFADGKEHVVYEVKNGFITIKGKEYPIKLPDGFYIIRKLTVRECMRLQTVPEWYDFSVVSDTQAYKMLGNGWTVAVISYLLSHTLE